MGTSGCHIFVKNEETWVGTLCTQNQVNSGDLVYFIFTYKHTLQQTRESKGKYLLLVCNVSQNTCAYITITTKQ